MSIIRYEDRKYSKGERVRIFIAPKGKIYFGVNSISAEDFCEAMFRVLGYVDIKISKRKINEVRKHLGLDSIELGLARNTGVKKHV